MYASFRMTRREWAWDPASTGNWTAHRVTQVRHLPSARMLWADPWTDFDREAASQ